MNRRAISLGRILGIPIGLKPDAELMDALGEIDLDDVISFLRILSELSRH